MDFDEYQKNALRTAMYPDCNSGSPKALRYTILALGGETGELTKKIQLYNLLLQNYDVKTIVYLLKENFTEKMKEIIEKKNFETLKKEIIKELGDVLYYLTMCTLEIGSSLEEVAKTNIEKIKFRKEKGTICGNGDSR